MNVSMIAICLAINHLVKAHRFHSPEHSVKSWVGGVARCGGYTIIRARRVVLILVGFSCHVKGSRPFFLLGMSSAFANTLRYSIRTGS